MAENAQSIQKSLAQAINPDGKGKGPVSSSAQPASDPDTLAGLIDNEARIMQGLQVPNFRSPLL